MILAGPQVRETQASSMEASSVMRTVLAAGIVGQALCYISPNGMLLAPARTCLVPVGARMPRGCTTTAGPRRVAALQASQAAASPPAAEARLLELVQSTKGRGQSATKTQLQEIQDAIAELERSGGEADPICSPLIAGCAPCVGFTPVREPFTDLYCVGLGSCSIPQSLLSTSATRLGSESTAASRASRASLAQSSVRTSSAVRIFAPTGEPCRSRLAGRKLVRR